MIKLKPVAFRPRKREKGLADGTGLYRLAFRATSDRYAGEIELRYPEVLRSSMGFHFLDHYRDTIWPLSEPVPFPQWQCDGAGTRMSYEYHSAEGLYFSGAAQVVDDTIELTYDVANNTGQDLAYLEVNVCLDMTESPDIEPNNLDRIFAVHDGHFQSLAATTPKIDPACRQVWPLILTARGRDTFEIPKDAPDWTLLDQVAEENLMAAQTRDGRTLIGYAWHDMPETLMSNGRFPCLHTGPGLIEDIKHGQKHHWFGKIYVVDNDPEKLLQRYYADKEQWARS